jgi:hypothetical protein
VVLGLVAVGGAALLMEGSSADPNARKRATTPLDPAGTAPGTKAVAPDAAVDGDATLTAEPASDATGTQKEVSVSVYAPPQIAVGEDCLIQVFLHGLQPQTKAEVEQQATATDEQAGLFGSMPLSVLVSTGDTVRVTVDGRGLAVTDPVQTFIWRGRIAQIVFPARLAIKSGASSAPGAQTTYNPIIRVFVNDAPAGLLRIKLVTVTDPNLDMAAAPVIEASRRFNRAFMSYASPDRAEVLRMAQMLRTMRVDFFQDLLSLEPGQRWENRLYEEIDACDAFLVFWSSNAKASEWVLKEIEVALDRRKTSPDNLPEIIPVVLEGPPIPTPPPQLGHLHFDDPLQSIIYAERLGRKKAA